MQSNWFGNLMKWGAVLSFGFLMVLAVLVVVSVAVQPPADNWPNEEPVISVCDSLEASQK